MTVVRFPATKGVQRFLRVIKEWLRRNQHVPVQVQHKGLAAKLRGYFQYFGLWHCGSKLQAVRDQVIWYWIGTLRRRSQRHHITWEWLQRRSWFHLPSPRVVHPMV